jgi:hypothetical protein
MRVDWLSGYLSSKCTNAFNVDQMRKTKDSSRPASLRVMESARIPLVGSSTTTEALQGSSFLSQFADRPRSRTPGWIGFARSVPSNHSGIVGRYATRSNSLLMKSERLMPSRAARDLSVACRESGTSRTGSSSTCSKPTVICSAHVNSQPRGPIGAKLLYLTGIAPVRNRAATSEVSADAAHDESRP